MIGSELCAQAYWDGKRCNWVGRSPLEAVDRRAPLVPTAAALGPDFYGGTAGIALFLAQLHAFTGETRLRQTALGAIAHALSGAERIPVGSRLGFYAGAIGIAYAGVRVGRLLDAEESLRSGQTLARRTVAEHTDDHVLDLVGGSAGALWAPRHE